MTPPSGQFFKDGSSSVGNLALFIPDPVPTLYEFQIRIPKKVLGPTPIIKTGLIFVLNAL